MRPATTGCSASVSDLASRPMVSPAAACTQCNPGFFETQPCRNDTLGGDRQCTGMGQFQAGLICGLWLNMDQRVWSFCIVTCTVRVDERQLPVQRPCSTFCRLSLDRSAPTLTRSMHPHRQQLGGRSDMHQRQ
jgi:hypothetical protein